MINYVLLIISIFSFHLFSQADETTEGENVSIRSVEEEQISSSIFQNPPDRTKVPKLGGKFLEQVETTFPLCAKNCKIIKYFFKKAGRSKYSCFRSQEAMNFHIIQCGKEKYDIRSKSSHVFFQNLALCMRSKDTMLNTLGPNHRQWRRSRSKFFYVAKRKCRGHRRRRLSRKFKKL